MSNIKGLDTLKYGINDGFTLAKQVKRIKNIKDESKQAYRDANGKICYIDVKLGDLTKDIEIGDSIYVIVVRSYNTYDFVTNVVNDEDVYSFVPKLADDPDMLPNSILYSPYVREYLNHLEENNELLFPNSANEDLMLKSNVADKLLNDVLDMSLKESAIRKHKDINELLNALDNLKSVMDDFDISSIVLRDAEKVINNLKIAEQLPQVMEDLGKGVRYLIKTYRDGIVEPVLNNGYLYMYDGDDISVLYTENIKEFLKLAN